MRRIDYLLVGQGLAGTFLSWYLRSSGKSVVVIDHAKASSASLVAAGIIHPITGRRIVKTWMADILLPFATKAYREIESHLGIKVFSPVPILELVSTPAEYNEWMARSGDPDYKGFIESLEGSSSVDDAIQPFFKKIVIRHASRVDISTLLQSCREDLRRSLSFHEESFDQQQLRISAKGVEYKDLIASKIIFCEGADAVANPLWNLLPFLPVKGEVLTLRADLETEYVLNRKCYVLPVGNKLFKAGSTYTWHFEDDRPTLEAREFLIGQVKKILKIPFEVVDHKAGVRPAVKNRRPLLGFHPEFPAVAIFNGLGTKGCLLAPWFAKHFHDHLLEGTPLLPEVDVSFRTGNS